MDVYKQKTSTYTYICFLWCISFGWASANFETHFRPHTATACESVYHLNGAGIPKPENGNCAEILQSA